VESRTIDLPALRAPSAQTATGASAWPPLVAIEAVDEMFADVDADTLEAIRMAAAELAENVVKFGEQVEGVTGRVVISRTEEAVEIRTANRLSDSSRAKALSDRLQRIGKPEDLEGQFAARIAEIMQGPAEQSTALGLLRIAYEGLFSLSCSYANATMTVVAARSIR
jgi:hypothetical protein